MEDHRGKATNVIYSYAHHVDNLELDAFEHLFTTDAEIHGVSDEILTPKLLRERIKQNRMGQPNCSPRHLLSNLLFSSLTDVNAEGSVYVTYYETIDGTPSLLSSGVYNFELASSEDNWLISRWAFENDTGS